MGGCIGKARTRPCTSIRFDTPRRLILKLHDEFENLVAQCFLPYQFIVKANGNDTGVGYFEPQAHTTTQQQAPWPTFPAPSPPPAPVLNARSPVPSMNFRPVPVDQYPPLNANLSVSILQRLAPAEGPVSGGPTILLSGINFPPPYQQVVYARFGSVAVPTVWLLFLPPQKTHFVRRPGTIRTPSSAICLLLRLRGQSVFHSHYPKSPERQNSARVTARLDTN